MLGADTSRMDELVPPADRATDVGVRNVDGPEGATVVERDKLPDSPLTLVKIMVEFEEEPAGMDKDPWFAETVKSTT